MWKRKNWASFMLSSLIVLNVVTPASADVVTSGGGTYFTDTDNWNGVSNNGVDGAADGDLDYVRVVNRNTERINNGHDLYPIEFKVTGVDKQPQKSAYFLVRAYDVDEYDGTDGTGEWDRVYFSSKPEDINLDFREGATWATGTPDAPQKPNYRKEFPQSAYVGALSGNNNTWNTTVLKVDPTRITSATDYYAGVSIHHYNKVASNIDFNDWVVQIDWGQLVIDGGVREKGEITKGSLQISGGKMNVDTSFIPKVNGNFDMEVSLIQKAADGSEQNLDTKSKWFNSAAAGTEKPWTGIQLGSGLDPTKEYFVNIILFDDRDGDASNPDPGKAEHLYRVSTFDPKVSDIAKAGYQYDPVGFVANDFKSKFYKLNGTANGTNLQKVQINTLPDTTKGKLVLDDGINPPSDVTLGQEIVVADLPNLKFVPATNGFTSKATFQWNGYDGTQYAAFNANVDITPNLAPTLGDFSKSVNKGETVSFTQADFTGKFVDLDEGSLNKVKIVTLPDPTLGKLVRDTGSSTVDVALNEEILKANLAQLKFIPENGASGVATFKWNGYDNVQYAHEAGTISILINNPPVVADIVKTGLAGAVIPFSAADFSVSPAYTDSDSDTLSQVKITLPIDFDTKGKLWYTSVSSAVYITQGSTVNIDKDLLDNLKFQPSASLPNGSTVTFDWKGSDGKLFSDTAAHVKIAYNGVPVASPLEVSMEEGDQPVTIILKGTDMESVTGLVYGIKTMPTHGTLVLATSNNTDEDKWIYTPNPNFSGTDSFTYTVTDPNTQKSQPATVGIVVNKLLDGWAGNKEQGDSTILKIIPGQLLQLTAVSSLQAAQVTATVNGIPVALTLTNAETFASDGFKKWGTATYTLPVGTSPGEYTVTFAAETADHTSLPAEPNSKLGDNKFKVSEPAILKLTADPARILGDGKSTSKLTAVLKDAQGTPIPDVEVVFTAPTAGSFVGSNTAITDSQGKASVTFKSAKITGINEQQIPVLANVFDIPNGISAEDQINITFLPPTISGVITKGDTHQAVPGATVRVTLDINNDGKIEAGVDFDQQIVTQADGSYSLPVPEGDREYSLEITQTVNIGGVESPVTYTQKASVGNVTGDGNDNFNSEETVTGIVLFKNQDGSSNLLHSDTDSDLVDNMKIYLKDPQGNYILDSASGLPKGFKLQDQGVFNAVGLSKGITYDLEVRYEIAPGQEITIKHSTVEVTATGEMNISQELIDPYGTITDAVTHQAISGAKVSLKYANTQRNIDNGRTPNTGVNLPEVLGFDPHNNLSPDQLTTTSGFYAYMVYPQTDYYLVISKDGYLTKTSNTISVEFDIVKYDAELTPVPQGSYVVPAAPNVSLNLSVDKSLVKEGDSSTITVDYKNSSSYAVGNGTVSTVLPEGAQLVDANGGTVDGKTISWNVTNLSAGQTGSFKITVKWDPLTAADQLFDISGQFIVNKDATNATNAAKADAAVQIKVFSDRFGNLKHQRYILGYPNGKFESDNSLTRAELAAIVARLTENVTVNEKLTYKDVSESHWAANYIKIATKHGYFSGFEDGNFRPEAHVSRGELAKVMATFLQLQISEPGSAHFKDTQGHWAGNAIEALYRGKFLAGYEDGTFKPQGEIRRVEAVTMINRMLYRGPLKGLTPLFPDVAESYWGYGDIQEATSSHESVRNQDGSETWKIKLEDDVK